MRRFTYIFFALVLIFLSACANKEESKESEQNKEQTVDVDKGLFNVEITLPASMFEGQDINKVIADVEKEGIKVTKNEDGSLTYKMSKTKHKKMMKEMKANIIDVVNETKQNKEDYKSIKDITYNDSFTEFTMVVDKATYENSMDGFAAFGLGMAGMVYQLYNGVKSEDTRVTIYLKDQATQKQFDQIVYPDDFNDKKSE
ncbi:hypothetical protein QFZ87_003042 [Bacillus sp. SLBN-46]|uniref:hypothetical protein n=1 Tax=Bacillus sp. SLBN-46 TaxID=3042283 RepID=UPI002866FF1A|nr:hypothetical protein [Bacillus sp. SLBN-46]MDR6123445.1 hypothetical protein [Bacillus sp. SLBN-46]